MRGFETCGTDELKERLQADDIATFVDLAYCQVADEDCLLNKCNVCGKDEDTKYRFLRTRLGDLSDETLDRAIGWQTWEKDEDGVWVVVDYIEPLSVVLRVIVQWIIKEQMGLHERQVCLQSQFQTFATQCVCEQDCLSSTSYFFPTSPNASPKH